MSKTFYQMTDCDDGDGGAGAWMPTEYFVDLILEGVYTYGQLSGKLCTIGTDLKAGNGDTVNVRYVKKRTSACNETACGNCLSFVSSTFGDYTIDVKQYGDGDKIADFADFRAKGDIMAQVANEMGKRLAHCRDLKLWQALTGATYTGRGVSSYTTTSSWSTSRVIDGSCCSFGFDIYNCIIDARARLKGQGYDPDYALIHPYVASYLYYKEGSGGNAYPMSVNALIKYGEDGFVKTIAGMKVIEVGVAVDDDSSPDDGNGGAAGDELAFVIDSKRALAEAWGQRPKFNEWYDGQCNATELTVWTYWGCDTLDDSAIIKIINP